MAFALFMLVMCMLMQSWGLAAFAFFTVVVFLLRGKQ